MKKLWEAIQLQMRKLRESLAIQDKLANQLSTPFKVTEVSVMVSKKTSVNFNSCCVSYSVKATLNENNQDHLKALQELKDQLVVKVQEALNGKAATSQTVNSTAN